MIEAEEASRADVRWDLTPLEPAAGSEEAFRELLDRCAAFRDTYESRVATLEPRELRSLLDELGELWNELSRLAAYATLRLAVAVAGTEEIELATTADAALADAADLLRFVELEWLAVAEDAAAAQLKDAALEPYRHSLGARRRLRPHTLSAAEERALAARDAAAEDAWIALYDQTITTVAVDLAGSVLTIDELLTRLRDPVAARRHAALEALGAALRERLSTIAHCYDSLVADRLAVDELRAFDGPRAARDLENELPSAAVDRMLAAVEDAYPLAREWFERKERLLGLPLTTADEHAPVGPLPEVGFTAAIATVTEVLDGLDPRLGSAARRFVEESRIDAAPRAGKAGNALCLNVSQDRDPYVLVNYTGRLSDALKLAHELGHGVHHALARQAQTPLTFEAPVAVSEIPSTLTELLVAAELIARAADDDVRRALLAERVEASFDAIFRQVVMTRYEQAAYETRAAGQPLLAERLCELWLDANRRYYGTSVSLPDAYAPGWAYVAHLVHGRFYNYSYAFAQLACLILRARLHDDRDAFARRYVAFLTKGGSQGPVQQLAELGVDLEAGDVWERALDELASLVRELLAATEPSPPPHRGGGGDGVRA